MKQMPIFVCPTEATPWGGYKEYKFQYTHYGRNYCTGSLKSTSNLPIKQGRIVKPSLFKANWDSGRLMSYSIQYVTNADSGQRHNGGKVTNHTTSSKIYRGGSSNIGFYDGHVDKLDKPETVLKDTPSFTKDGYK
jgi:prepilin-type processing-associated H-X9-DG protein